MDAEESVAYGVADKVLRGVGLPVLLVQTALGIPARSRASSSSIRPGIGEIRNFDRSGGA